MVEKDTIIKEKVKYAGLGNFKDAYKYAYEWLKDRSFSVIEESYSEKISGNSKDIEVSWAANKKITDYFKITLGLKWRVMGMTDVEVEIDGKKKNMNKFAELTIELKGVLEKDYNSKWENTPINRFLRDTYHKFVIPARTEQKEGEVMAVVQDFKEEMKAFFDLSARR